MQTPCSFALCSVLIASICCRFSSDAQVTFNQRFHWNSSTLASNIWLEEDGYVCSGIYTDTIGDADAGLFIRKVDLDGNVTMEKFFSRDEWDVYNYQDAGCSLSNGQHVLATYLNSNNLDYCLVWWFDTNWDTLQTIRYPSYYGIDHFIQPLYTVSDSLDNVYVATQVEQNGLDHFMITKFDPSGIMQWQYLFETELEPEICYCLSGTMDGVIVACGQSMPGITPPNKRLFHLITNDINQPELEWEIDVIAGTIKTGYPQEIIAFSDNIIIAADYTETNWTGVLPAVYEIDYSGNIQWFTPVMTEYYPQFRMLQVVRSSDGGLLGCAREIDESITPTPEDGDYNENCLLAKYNGDGELLWTRRYHYVNSPEDQHKVNDLKACPDGGFIFCGEATDLREDEFGNNLDTVPQCGWLVKVDSMGCLIPGCSVGILEPDQPVNFLIYPNPVDDLLNIYLETASDPKGLFRILDSTGKIVHEFNVLNNNTTYIADVHHLNSGIYLLHYIQDNHVGKIDKFVIQH